MRLPDLPDLPVRAALDDIVGALAEHGTLVLAAPPGTGKTTLVPLALAAATEGAAEGKVLVAEPRRLAARAAARRMAALLGEDVGRTVGFSVRGDRAVSARTRIEVVTSGLLVRRLMADPELAGTATVMLDECHERHLDADLLLALLLDARDGIRPDLRLLATSATVDVGRLGELLGGAPVIELAARTFPVDVRHVPPARGERIEACVARAVRTALSSGDVLAFLPGAAEIRRTATALDGIDADVLTLHGRMPAAQQDRVFQAGGRPRVVLATAVAESSLTVPGVRAVVDAGLARVPRVDHRRGLAGLATVRVSAAVADQRAGRAGREAPGAAFRCWPAGELLPRYPEPEIRTADLTRLALDLADWGTPDGSGLTWWDPPPDGPLRAGQQVLAALGALDRTDGGTITPRGRRMAGLGLHPRLARALLDGSERVGARTAAEVVALLDDDTLTSDVEVDAALRALRAGSAPGAGRWKAEVSRLTRLVAAPDRRQRDGSASALVVALAHPERLARRRAGDAPVFLMAGGTGVELVAGGPLGAQEWLAVAVADRRPGAQNGTVRLAAAADADLAIEAAPAMLAEADEVGWERGDVVARHVRRLGAIVLDERPLARPDPAAVRAALLTGLRTEGLGLLRWTDRARSVRTRMALLHRVLGEPWPDVSDDALLADPDRWWTPQLAAARRRADLARVEAGDVLRAVLPWQLAGSLDELAPERVQVPSGSRIALDYGGDQPVLAVRLQEVLGWTATPTVAGGRVPVVLHLLSPAGRPAAVTGDLASFWTGGYPQVRAELRGRYPKHSWPEDPLTATPTRRPGR
ncbi:ATP-dependent helicase HrpB [Pseudonocardia sp. TRM90224]|uniref:ATP-dependent helicase HrpB n=1 Tax=Pseudonocardia sp. TRM90224 TaxID=2812678 RepID=UPI001E499EB1|nr:ATP-dependent helicase HrpB [Pseudonocardia sp. TRM90224]